MSPAVRQAGRADSRRLDQSSGVVDGHCVRARWIAAPGRHMAGGGRGEYRARSGLAAALKGYRLIVVIPDKMSSEKILHLEAMGADVVMTRSDVGKAHPPEAAICVVSLLNSCRG